MALKDLYHDTRGLPPTWFCLPAVCKMRGDVNDDGFVDMRDGVCIVNYLLHPTAGIIHEEWADINHDGRITITDAVALSGILAH